MWANRSIFKGAAPADGWVIGTVGSRRRDFIELAGIYGLILLVIWTPQPWQWPMWGLASVSIVAVIAMSFEGVRPMGLCSVNLLKSLWAVALAMTIAILAILVAGRMHTLQLASSPMWALQHYGGYVVWAGLQQLILQSFFLSRSLRLVGNATAAAAISAGLFAIAHLPNPILTLITLFFGLASCLFFLHYKNLWPLVAAHAILGISIAVTIPGPLDHNMMVGIGYLQWDDGQSEHAKVSTPMSAPKAYSIKP